MTNLRIDIRRVEGAVEVAFSGELDIAEMPRLEQEFEAIHASKPPLLVLDLRDLSFIDSSGLRFILETDVRVRREARRVVLIPGPNPVHRIFLIALLDKRLEFIGPERVEELHEEEG
jgi:anti-sigma B factor antagonist